MNARVDILAERVAEAMRPALEQVLHDIVNSALFARAPRTCNLLSFLVQKMLDGKEQEITEHAIGLAVFRRDARSYDTTLDPVVRVQMGRLRARLAEYQAAQGAPGLCLTIPLGSYVPAFNAAASIAAPLPALKRPIQLSPLRNLAGAGPTSAFVAGVDEELGSKLFHAFGSLVQLPQHALGWGTGTPEARHRLEGSIRVEHQHVRASMRLVDTRAGDIAWLSQIDCRGELGMRLQEELAGVICGQLQRYLASV